MANPSVMTETKTEPFSHIWHWSPRMGERNRKGLRVRLLVTRKRCAMVETEDGELVICRLNCLRKI